MTFIIGIGHQARRGKDTAAAALVRELGFHRVGFADALKDLAVLIDPMVVPQDAPLNVGIGRGRLAGMVTSTGWDEVKKRHPEARRFLQALGEGVRTVLGDSIWVDTALRDAAGHERIVIPDVRYPNEVEAIRAAGGFIVKIERRVPPMINGEHLSETALLNFEDWDQTFDNNGSIVDLEQAVVKWANEKLHPPKTPAPVVPLPLSEDRMNELDELKAA